jgi:hypothetical protein
MLKGNLSTRPFYSERLATLAIGAIAALVLLLTLFNAMQLIALSSERRELRARIDRDRGEAASVRAATADVVRTVDRAALSRLKVSTGEANDVIDQRTFSWTGFFGVIEQTLPGDVRLVVVSPRADRGAFRVSMTIVARELADAAAFVDALLDSGRFYDVATLEQQRREDGAFNAVVEASYLASPPAAPPVSDATRASAPPPGATR